MIPICHVSSQSIIKRMIFSQNVFEKHVKLRALHRLKPQKY